MFPIGIVVRCDGPLAVLHAARCGTGASRTSGRGSIARPRPRNCAAISWPRSGAGYIRARVSMYCRHFGGPISSVRWSCCWSFAGTVAVVPIGSYRRFCSMSSGRSMIRWPSRWWHSGRSMRTDRGVSMIGCRLPVLCARSTEGRSSLSTADRALGSSASGSSYYSSGQIRSNLSSGSLGMAGPSC